ncbi:sugar ABC transporter substrate-binding protein [Frondihabitans sp. PAMC 28766]|uniref:ABC transporter substrate-binding protein n=1 Tax=Frondihabitans sp. PAMC 28766 TaxID=1795630 RepID=UPI00078C6850|nr:extracellular solute-binding protein [Frondihabitans sp. PAMC 28766]AMM19612.1 sugar ABC transporter substrate-binding protein [Frondihabitans sp. PAMC 28766]
MKFRRRYIAPAAGAVALAMALTGCGTSSTPSSGKTSITVSIDTGLTAAAKQQIDQRITAFEKVNPDITVKTQPYDWVATTFTAQLAGGTLPDVFTVPFTDGRSLIAQKQVADISSLVDKLPYVKDFNPSVVTNVKSTSGQIEGVPISAYGQALYYNRQLFTQAGLDPNKPPTTWAEVRSDAKAIATTTKEAGFSTMTQSNTGGWSLVTLANAFGGRAETGTGKKVKATVDTKPFEKALETLHDMRWTDDSMGGDFLYDWNAINQDFAAGKIGMYISGGGNYTSLVQQNAIDPKTVGQTVIPLSGKNAGALGGGAIAFVRAGASSAVQSASVKWIDYYYMQQQYKKSASVSAAKIAIASKQPVGVPQVPVFDKKTYEQTLAWTNSYVNVPLKQFAPYTDKEFSQQIVSEPGTQTQALYGKLDPVVQAVLTDKNADIPTLLKQANGTIQTMLDSGTGN